MKVSKKDVVGKQQVDDVVERERIEDEKVRKEEGVEDGDEGEVEEEEQTGNKSWREAIHRQTPFRTGEGWIAMANGGVRTRIDFTGATANRTESNVIETDGQSCEEDGWDVESGPTSGSLRAATTTSRQRLDIC